MAEYKVEQLVNILLECCSLLTVGLIHTRNGFDFFSNAIRLCRICRIRIFSVCFQVLTVMLKSGFANRGNLLSRHIATATATSVAFQSSFQRILIFFLTVVNHCHQPMTIELCWTTIGLRHICIGISMATSTNSLLKWNNNNVVYSLKYLWHFINFASSTK